MTNDNHPITPPPELIRKWNEEAATAPMADQRYIAIFAARWGYEQRGADIEDKLQKARDEELEACCEHLKRSMSPRATIDYLRAARRPEPLSLKEQALQVLANADGADHPVVTTVLTADQHALIRKALEQLND